MPDKNIKPEFNIMPQPLQPPQAQPRAPIQEKFKMYKLPTSPATDLAAKAFGAGGKLDSLEKPKNSHGATITVYKKITEDENGNRREERAIVSTTPQATTKIEFSDISKFTKSNKSVNKIFSFILIKANEFAFNNEKELISPAISFPLSELVDIGAYSNIESARVGFKNAMGVIDTLKCEGVTQDQEERTPKYQGRILFIGEDIDASQGIVYLNPLVNWKDLFQYFSILPSWAFSLSNRAFNVMNYICYLSRIKSREIAEKGYFPLAFSTIANRLNMPDADTCKRPAKYIKTPILEIFDEIETKAAEHGEKGIQFELFEIDGSFKNFYEHGRVHIILNGEYRSYFGEISRSKTKKISKAQKQKKKRY